MVLCSENEYLLKAELGDFCLFIMTKIPLVISASVRKLLF